MSAFKSHLCDTSFSTRFVDVVDFQGNGFAKDDVFIKYFDSNEQMRELSYGQYRYLVYSASNQFKEKIEDDMKIYDIKGTSITAGYLSNSDKDCIINQVGLMYLNITPLALSPRNSIEILVHLIKESDAKFLIHDESCKDKALLCKKALPSLVLVSKLKFNSEFIEPIDAPSPIVESQGLEQITLILHSSGSTSFPKLIKFSNRYMLTFVERSRKDPIEQEYLTSILAAVAPMFHIMGFSMYWRVLFQGTTLVLPSSNISAKKILNQVSTSQSTSLTMLPLQIRLVVDYCTEARQEDGWELLKNIRSFNYSGAPLPEALVTKLINRGFKIVNTYGTTEAGILGTGICDLSDPNPKKLTLYPDFDFTLVDQDGERCQLLINEKDKALATGVCKPQDEGYFTGDIIRILHFEKAKKYLQFEVLGRNNDIIVHLSGEKTNPIPMEDTIMECRLVDKCVILGSGKLNNCLLIQLNKENSTNTPIKSLISEIYQIVSKANEQAPSYSRIDYDLIHILSIDPSIPLPTTAKGNIIRAKSELLFEDEIHNMYTNFGNTQSYTKPKLNTNIDLDGIKSTIVNVFHEITERTLEPKDSFFKQGMDSLSAVKFTNQLKFLYPKSKMSINIVYEMDSLDTLADYINDMSKGKKLKLRTLEFYQNEVDTLLTQYSKFTEIQTVEKFLPHKNDKLNVLVTGANGSLGSFVIKSLLERDQVGYIYGLVRAPNNEEAIKKLKSELFSRKVDLSLDQWSRVKAFAYITDDPRLGLSAGDYKIIFDTTDVIYHVAWRMDFLKGVGEFKDCIEGTVNLLKISATSPKKPVFHFTSTVGAILPVNTTPEIEEARPSTTLVNIESCNGYNLSKLVSEILCFKWAENFGFSLDIHRVGQVSGDTVNGIWNVREHIPLLIKAAQVMKIVPESFMESVAWIPVDYAANAMVEINFAANNFHKGTVNHIVNPNSTSWKKIIVILQELGVECKPVSNKEFVEALHSHAEFQDVDINPLASLADFFTVLLDKKEPFSIEMKTEGTSQRSLSINTCPTISKELMFKYINSWVAIGFLAKTKAINVVL